MPPPGPVLYRSGDVGKLTWGALFDCYEAALRDELGEDEAGVAELREKLVFADAEDCSARDYWIGVPCPATICHLPPRRTNVSVQRYRPLMSRPLYLPLSVVV